MVYINLLLFLCNVPIHNSSVFTLLHLTRTTTFSAFTTNFLKIHILSSQHIVTHHLYHETFSSFGVCNSILIIFLSPHIIILYLLHWLFLLLHVSVDLVFNAPVLFSLFTLEISFDFMDTSREAGGVPCLNPRRGLTLLSPVCRDPAIGV